MQDNPCKNIKITGIHVHLKSQVLDAGILAAYYEKMFQLAKKVANICQGLEYVNMGSGMGVQHTPTDSPLDLPMLGMAFENKLNDFRNCFPNTKIIIETGRYVVCKSGIFVTKVMDRKISYGKTYLILKNVLNGFMRPSLAKLIERYAADETLAGFEPLFTAKDAFEIYSLKDDAATEVVTLVGNLCTSADVLAENILLPHLECGDIVVVTNAGSYAAVLSPLQFSTQEKPEELFLTQSGAVI